MNPRSGNNRKKGISLQLFIGYQFNSKFHTQTDLRILRQELKRALSRPQRTRFGENVFFRTEIFEEFKPGEETWAASIDQIGRCDVAIFDISENNANVLLEAGLAFGMRKPVVLLRSKKSTHKVPSNIRGRIFLQYSSDEFNSGSLAKTLETHIRKILDTSSEEDAFYFRQLWSLDPGRHTYVLPGLLPPKYENAFEDFVRLRSYTDIDAVFLIAETLTRLYPEMRVSVLSNRSTGELPDDWSDSNLVIVGGPDFNPLFKEFAHRCPIEYRYGQESAVWLHHRTTGRKYVPSFDNEAGAHDIERTAQDHGFFLKIPLNENGRGKLVVLGGARTWGVYGAAMLVSCRGFLGESSSAQNVRMLVERLGSDPSFLLPIVVKGTRKGTHPPQFVLDDVEPL